MGVAHGSRVVRVVAVARVVNSAGEPLLGGLVASTVVGDDTVGGAGQDRVHLDDRIGPVLVEREWGVGLFLLTDNGHAVKMKDLVLVRHNALIRLDLLLQGVYLANRLLVQLLDHSVRAQLVHQVVIQLIRLRLILDDAGVWWCWHSGRGGARVVFLRLEAPIEA